MAKKTMKNCPDLTNFDYKSAVYGIRYPYVGVGVYTLDRKYSWPDREGTMENEYRAWEKHLIESGFDIPEKYEDAFLKVST